MALTIDKVCILSSIPNFEFESGKSPEGFWLNSSPYPYTIGLILLFSLDIIARVFVFIGWKIKNVLSENFILAA